LRATNHHSEDFHAGQDTGAVRRILSFHCEDAVKRNGNPHATRERHTAEEQIGHHQMTSPSPAVLAKPDQQDVAIISSQNPTPIGTQVNNRKYIFDPTIFTRDKTDQKDDKLSMSIVNNEQRAMARIAKIYTASPKKMEI